MKKTINGKQYNTEISGTCVATRTIGVRGDMGYLKESLYRTPRSGDYFLAGESGPWGTYAKYIRNNVYGRGEGIRPLTKTQAVAWLKEYC